MEEGMATHCSILAWRVLRQRSWGGCSHRVTAGRMWRRDSHTHTHPGAQAYAREPETMPAGARGPLLKLWVWVALGKLLNLSEFSSLVCEMQRLLISPIHGLVVRFNLINRCKAAKTVHDVPLVMWASTVFIYRHRWCIQVACSTDSQRNACLAKVLVWSPYVGSVLSSLPNFYTSLSVVSVPFTYFHWPSRRRRLKFVHNLCYSVICSQLML